MSLVEHEFDRILAAKSDTEVFNLSPTWTVAGLRDAHRRLRMLVHPDKHADKGEAVVLKASNAFVAVQAAFDRLMVSRGETSPPPCAEGSSSGEGGGGEGEGGAAQDIFNPFSMTTNSSTSSTRPRGPGAGRLARSMTASNRRGGARARRPQSTALHRIFQTNTGEDNEVVPHSGETPDGGLTSQFSSSADFLGLAEEVDRIDPGTDLVSAGGGDSTSSDTSLLPHGTFDNTLDPFPLVSAAAAADASAAASATASAAAAAAETVEHTHEHTHTYTHTHPHTHAPGHESEHTHPHAHPHAHDQKTTQAATNDTSCNTGSCKTVFVFGNGQACVRVQDVSFVQNPCLYDSTIVVALRGGQMVSVPYGVDAEARDKDMDTLVTLLGL